MNLLENTYKQFVNEIEQRIKDALYSAMKNSNHWLEKLPEHIMC